MKEMKNIGYYEGVLQLRNPNDEVFAYINKQLFEEPKVRIVKKRRMADGVDYYLNDQRFLQKLGKRLQERFNAQLKTSIKLHSTSRMTSRKVYRVTVLARIPSFEVGQIVEVHGKPMKVLEIKKNVRMQEIKTGKTHIFDFDYVNEKMQK